MFPSYPALPIKPEACSMDESFATCSRQNYTNYGELVKVPCCIGDKALD